MTDIIARETQIRNICGTAPCRTVNAVIARETSEYILTLARRGKRARLENVIDRMLKRFPDMDPDVIYTSVAHGFGCAAMSMQAEVQELRRCQNKIALYYKAQ